MSFTQAHALLIGIGAYAHAPHMNVPITARDAEQLQSVLANPEFCGYPDGQVTFLHDSTARRADILAALDDLATVSPDATVLFFYCGHGDYATDGNYYLTTHDTELEGARIKAGTGVSEAELVKKLRAIPAKRLLLFFNACHSGEISPNLNLEEQAIAGFGSQTLSSATADAILSTGEGRIIITACRPEQKSWIGSGETTIFTRALIQGFSGQGLVSNRGGYIGAYDLYEHIYFAVKDATEAFGKVQEPELTVLRGVGPFPVALYRGTTSLGDFTASETPPTDTAARTVDPAMSQRILERRFAIKVSGDRAVVAGRDMKDNVIVTGDSNVVQTATGNNIAQASGGGTATVNDQSSHSVFDQRNQTVHGHQYNIKGDYNPAAAQNRATAIEELQKLIDELNRARAEDALPTKVAVNARQSVENALVEAEDPQPDKRTILDHLAKANEVIATAAAATGLVTAISQAIQMVQKLF